MENNKEGFKYTYSAKEQEELKRIRDKYTGEEDKLQRLRRLDAGVTEKAQVISLIMGIVGSLIFGFGMSLVMSDLGVKMGMTGDLDIILGVVFGAIGGVVLGFAYPVYNFVLKKERKRVAPEIIRLADELIVK